MGVQFQQGTDIVGIEKAVTRQLIVNGVRAGRWVICNNGGNMASPTQQRLQTHVHPHPLFINNQSFILFAKNNISNNRTKHIDMHYHYTCNEVTVGNIQLHYIPRTANPANILTKALSPRCEVCLRYFTKSLRAMVFMQTVYSTVVRGNSNWVCDKG